MSTKKKAIERPFRIILAGCPTEKYLKAVYYPKTDSVLVDGEQIPLQMLVRFGQTAIRPNL